MSICKAGPLGPFFVLISACSAVYYTNRLTIGKLHTAQWLITACVACIALIAAPKGLSATTATSLAEMPLCHSMTDQLHDAFMNRLQYAANYII